MNEMVIVIVIVAIGAAIASGIYLYMKKQQEQNNQYQKQEKVLVKNGVNVKESTLNMQKGAYFAGNYEAKTSYIGVKNNVIWDLEFLDLKNNHSNAFSFYNRMWIGRQQVYANEVTFLLSDDKMVSKTHCMIYESNSRLCIEDMQSTNHTYVNGVQVESPMYLENDCILKVGDSSFRVYFAKRN